MSGGRYLLNHELQKGIAMKTVKTIYINVLISMCFVILPNFGAQADTINKITFADAIVDEKELLGKTVMIPGFIVNLGDTNFLYERQISMNAFNVVTKNLSNEQNKMIITECSSGCYVEVEGVLNENQTIMATEITEMKLMDKLMNIVKEYLSILF